VYLTGVVDTEEARREAARVAWRTEGVRGVVNDLTVGERTVGSWIDDVMISSKVKSKLIANSDIKAGDIDVGSSQGVCDADRPRQFREDQERGGEHRARHQGRQGSAQRTPRRQHEVLGSAGLEDCDALDDLRHSSRAVVARMITSYTMGGFIHVLLVVAVVVLIIRLVSGRRVL